MLTQPADVQEEEVELELTPEELEKRLICLLDTCTYTVYNYTRRGLFDRDKLIVLTLLTFSILMQSQVCVCECVCVGTRVAFASATRLAKIVYIYTVYDGVFDGIPAKSTVCSPYIRGSGQP